MNQELFDFSVKHKKFSAIWILSNQWNRISIGAEFSKSNLINQCCDIKKYDFENYGRRLRDLRTEGSIDYKSLGDGRIRKVS